MASIACGSTPSAPTPTEPEPTPNIDATAEAKVKKQQAIWESLPTKTRKPPTHTPKPLRPTYTVPPPTKTPKPIPTSTPVPTPTPTTISVPTPTPTAVSVPNPAPIQFSRFDTATAGGTTYGLVEITNATDKFYEVSACLYPVNAITGQVVIDCISFSATSV